MNEKEAITRVEDMDLSAFDGMVYVDAKQVGKDLQWTKEPGDSAISDIYRRIREAGIEYSPTHQFQNAKGEEFGGDDRLEDLAKVCTFGALYYAEKMGWICQDDTTRIVKRLKRLSAELFGNPFVTEVQGKEPQWNFGLLEGLRDPST